MKELQLDYKSGDVNTDWTKAIGSDRQALKQ